MGTSVATSCQQRTFHLDIEIVNVKFHRACLDKEMAGLHLTGPMPNMNQGMLSQQQQHQLQQSVMNAVNQPANPNSAADHQKLDHIAKVKNLLWPLKESLATGMKNAAQNFFHNGMIDNG